LIQNILTNPRPAPAGMQTGGGGQITGGGLVGVASKLEGPSIKVYNERSAYHEWEFIYDPKNDKSLALAGAPAPGGGTAPASRGAQTPAGAGGGFGGGAFGGGGTAPAGASGMPPFQGPGGQPSAPKP